MTVEPKASMLKHHTNFYSFQVEIQYAGNQYDNILRIAELEQLYERNGKALGMDFTTDEDVLKNEFGACVESYLKLLEVKTSQPIHGGVSHMLSSLLQVQQTLAM